MDTEATAKRLTQTCVVLAPPISGLRDVSVMSQHIEYTSPSTGRDERDLSPRGARASKTPSDKQS